MDARLLEDLERILEASKSRTTSHSENLLMQVIAMLIAELTRSTPTRGSELRPDHRRDSRGQIMIRYRPTNNCFDTENDTESIRGQAMIRYRPTNNCFNAEADTESIRGQAMIRYRPTNNCFDSQPEGAAGRPSVLEPMIRDLALRLGPDAAISHIKQALSALGLGEHLEQKDSFQPDASGQESKGGKDDQ